MSKTAAIPMDKEIQSFQLIFTGQQYNKIKDKKARQYLLRMVRGWKATNNP